MKTQTQHIALEKRRGPSGFTLIELMIVVAMVAVLALIVTVMARNAKRKSLEAAAMSPLRQVAMANMEFSVENNAKINTMRWVGDREEGGGGKFVQNSFWGRLGPYLFTDVALNNQNKLKNEINLRLDSFFASKDADKMTGTFLQGARIYHDGSGLPVPFSFNGNLYKYNNWVRMNQVSDPAQIIYISYGFAMFKATDAKTATPRPTDGSSTKIYYLDSGKAMVAFLDGRVEMLSPPMADRRFE